MAVGAGDGRHHGVRNLGDERLILRVESMPRIYSQHQEAERLAVPGTDQEHHDSAACRLGPRAARDGAPSPTRQIVDELRPPRAYPGGEGPRVLRLVCV